MKLSAALYWPCNLEKNSDDDILGRKLYKQFDVVVQLKTQVQVTDPEWQDLLHHVRHGDCNEIHLGMLRQLVLSHKSCPVTNFTCSPWQDAILVTPRHTVRMKWNSMSAKTRTQTLQISLIKCPAFDTIQGLQLSLEEKFAVATKPCTGRGRNRRERAGLANEVIIAIGMEILITFNISTDVDVANGAHGQIVDIVLDSREEFNISMSHEIELKYPPTYILVCMLCTRAHTLDGLDNGVLPITSLKKNFNIVIANGTKISVNRQQLPITPAYALTDYRSQAQTIDHCIVDLGTPPSGQLTPFNAYVALSRSWGRHSIRLLRDFDERLFTQHPNHHKLLNEDQRLQQLNRKTQKNWEELASRVK